MEIFQDKDAKISFLQKAVDVVVMVSGEPLSAKPVRIVAGHEPERTNELLQRIAKCCLSKVMLANRKVCLSKVVQGCRAGRTRKQDGDGRVGSVGRGSGGVCQRLCFAASESQEKRFKTVP